MVEYRCFNCGREIDKRQVERRIICPYCDSRIVIKDRPEVLKKVKAR